MSKIRYASVDSVPNTPEERDQKAKDLARQARNFKWEMRVYIFLLFALFFIEV